MPTTAYSNALMAAHVRRGKIAPETRPARLNRIASPSALAMLNAGAKRKLRCESRPGNGDLCLDSPDDVRRQLAYPLEVTRAPPENPGLL